MNEADKAALDGIAARRENTEVIFYEPAKLLSAETLAIIKRGAEAIKNHVTKTGYYRLLAADILPRDIHRALYLDGDIVCTDNLAPLFSTDLKGCPCGMCLDSPTANLWIYNILGYPPEDGYFNSGVMLLDLDAWRKENLSKTMIDYLDANAKKRLRHDQDVLNPVLHGRIFQIDFSYNVISPYFYVFYWLEEEKNGYLAHNTQCILKDKWPDVLSGVENHFLLGISHGTATVPILSPPSGATFTRSRHGRMSR